MNFWNFLVDNIEIFSTYIGFINVTTDHVIMVLVDTLFIFLDIRFRFKLLPLIPIGFDMLIGNIPFKDAGLQTGVYEEGSVLNILYQEVRQGWYPPLIFLGVGAIADFSALISDSKLMLIGTTVRFGIFGAYMIVLQFGFGPNVAGAIDIINDADRPTAIFLSSRLTPDLLGTITISTYSYIVLVPIIQLPFMRLLITDRERHIRMKAPHKVSRVGRILFPISGLLLMGFPVPSDLPLLGMLFFGNILRGSGVCDRLTRTAYESLINIITVLLGVTVGASTQVTHFLTLDSVRIFMLGALSFIIATCSGVPFVKVMNLFLEEGNEINPLIDNAGMSAVSDSARVSQIKGVKYDRTDYLLMHAMGPSVVGVTSSAVAAGILLSFLP